MKLFSYRRFVSGVFQPDSGLSDRFLFPESHFSFGGLPALPPTSFHSSPVMDVRLLPPRHTSSVLTAAFHRIFFRFCFSLRLLWLLLPIDSLSIPLFPVLFQSTALVASSSN
ncbi:hypothetical protein F2Q68_00022448 [Brassica cretica]|uniref:Transmembrane protein n=1 Tax=Brassica cretica TaxID=69181 RepID=A0A8S9FX67_BRACR|nr:hypothetical protein F2Q68_00022448 [Brassica cretica]